MIHGSLSYKVFFTPISQDDDNVYADEVDVSDRILLSGVGNIKQSIDASDYNIGVFTFSDLELKGFNFDGYFNENDRRSIFQSTRDRCRVRIVFRKAIMTRGDGGTVLDSTETDTVTFRGLINEEATRIELIRDQIRFKVLSRDSVLRTTQVSAGVINDGDLASSAIFSILNTPRITSVLSVSALNINPDLDVTIDDGGFFDSKGVKESLDKLLFASNSVLIIDDDGTIHVQSRAHDPDADPLLLFGKFDPLKRENIISIDNYNQGRHRAFTSVVVNQTQSTNTIFAQAYGLRTKTFDLPFITDTGTETDIADRVVDEFKVPKTEMEVTVATDLIRDIPILSPVSISYPLRIEPFPGTFLPVFSVTMFNDADAPFPLQFGSTSIDSRTGFKIIEIEHHPEKFTSKLKLRQFGIDLDDGFFNTPFNNHFSFAIFSLAEFGDNADTSDTWNPSVFGAGEFSLTELE